MANKKPIRHNNRSPKPNRTNQANKINKRFVRNKNSATVTDARQKIIQTKRKNVVDARDILSRMAKKQDARSKLLKIRETRTNGNSVQVIGRNILRKTGPDGKISLLTSKAKQQQQPVSDINLAIKQQLGLGPPVRSPKKGPKRALLARSSPTLIRKTILNDMEFDFERLGRGFEESESLYRWVRPDLRLTEPLKRPLVTRGRALIENGRDWGGFPPISRSVRPSAAYIDLDAVDDEEMPLVPLPTRQTISLQGSSRSSNVHSRLDTYPIEPQSHGILSHSTTTKTKVVVPAGHRIVVSNLQATVTQDDIKELFEDIGQLLVARLVRPGTAEVIYKNLRDAQKAVDTYHNRQLDGQPMKCLLVNKRPANNPTAPPVAPHVTSQGILSSSRSKVTDKLVPDISTIHKVLFQRK